MALTRACKETVQARARKDPAFRATLLTEGVEAFLAGDIETGKAVLRDYINATHRVRRPRRGRASHPGA